MEFHQYDIGYPLIFPVGGSHCQQEFGDLSEFVLFFVKLNYAAVWCSLQHICAFHTACIFLILFAAPLQFLYRFLLCTVLVIFLVSLPSPFTVMWSDIYYHVDTELLVIYAVHHPCHGSPYKPYLEDQ